MGEETVTINKETVIHSVNDEMMKAERLTVGGKEITLRPLKRRWQSLFRRAVLAYYRPELMATEEIKKSIEDGTASFKNISEMLVNSTLESDAELDEAAAIIMASQVVGAEKSPLDAIAGQKQWLLDNVEGDKEIRALVEAQSKIERIIDDVGEHLPARLARSARLAGDSTITEDSMRQLLTNFSPKSPEVRNGDGNSTTPKSGG